MKALTGNRLADGEVVFWTGGRWSPSFAEVQVMEDEALAMEAEALAKSQITVVVDPYLIDLEPSEGHWAPVSYRERLRALGPTNHPEHGKQAQGGEIVQALQHAHGAARSSGRVNLIKRK